MKWIKDLVGGVLSPVTKAYERNQERKQAKESGDAKLALAKANNETQVTLSDAEWEARSKSNEDNTWKDEYLTIVVTSPLVTLLVGGIWLAFTGDDRLLHGTKLGISAIKDAGVDLGELMYITVIAGLSLKLWRNR